MKKGDFDMDDAVKDPKGTWKSMTYREKKIFVIGAVIGAIFITLWKR